jgi:hypothetical protein
MCEWRSIGDAGNWTFDGSYFATSTNDQFNETNLRFNDSNAQEGHQQTLFISDGGYVFSFTGADGSDNANNISAKARTNSITLIPMSEMLYERTIEFSFNASSASSASSTVDLYYSTDDGTNWTLIEANIDLVPAWTEIIKPIDVQSRKIMFEFRANHTDAIEIRGLGYRVREGAHQ